MALLHAWHLSDRFDPPAREVADLHYNRQKPGTPQFAPPGRCLALLVPGDSVAERAVWLTSWPFPEFVRHEWPGAWINSAFRRESDCPYRASKLIRAAVAHTRWFHGVEPTWRSEPLPAAGMITFVAADQVEDKTDPGFCYVVAGFRYVPDPSEPDGRKRTKQAGHLVLQLSPERMPPPLAPVGQPAVFQPRMGGLD